METYWKTKEMPSVNLHLKISQAILRNSSCYSHICHRHLYLTLGCPSSLSSPLCHTCSSSYVFITVKGSPLCPVVEARKTSSTLTHVHFLACPSAPGLFNTPWFHGSLSHLIKMSINSPQDHHSSCRSSHFQFCLFLIDSFHSRLVPLPEMQIWLSPRSQTLSIELKPIPSSIK